MALEEYRRKRRFEATPEPPPKVEKNEGHRFVVQKHRASRLHYDFRLEHRGVMLSWAVPKGPSLDPTQKRLAMQTEPHPMDYNQFEGVIPEGEYGGGTVMIWDKGIWAPTAKDQLGGEEEVDRQLAKGELKFVLLGEKLAGSWVLVRTQRGDRQWLLIKHKDRFAAATASVDIIAQNRENWDKTNDVTGRVKELYKLDNGKYVAPVPLEEKLGLSLFISQVMVYGENRPFNVAVVVPDLLMLRALAALRDPTDRSGDG